MKKIRTILTASLMVLGLAALQSAPMAYAETPLGAACDDPKNTNSVICKQQKNASTKVDNLLTNIVGILMFVLGAICVIMIIVGGIRYATSGGDASQVKSAKDTILYSVVGLVVAIFAYAIVAYVVSNV